MSSFIRKLFRRSVYAGLAAAVTATAAPFGFEAWHNAKQEDRLAAAADDIAQARYFSCDAGAAGNLETQRAETLRELLLSAAGNDLPSWGKPLKIYQSGVRRLAEDVPFVGHDLSQYAGNENPSGLYATSFDNNVRAMTELARLGIGICYDKALAAQHIGSAYVPDKGLIALNPEMEEGDLTLQLQLQLQRLNETLSLPYGQLVKEANDLKSTFDNRAKGLTGLAASLQGPVVTLPAIAAARRADFKDLPHNAYAPPLPGIVHVVPPPPKKSVRAVHDHRHRTRRRRYRDYRARR